LKTNFLNEMKWDKAGAGVVVGVLEALSLAKIPVSVVGTIALAENMPDGGALKPGDVIETLSGKTVEIVDTDCEGRLVLADSMTYVQQAYSPKILIDIGTLTRETFGALGGKYGGLFCNDQQLEKELISAGKRAQEELWPLPLGSFFAKHIRSQIADLKNAGIQSYGASSAAAEFLRAFLNQEIPWAHLDIAGVAWDIMKPTKGITAFGVRLLYEWLRSTG
jgi:leucyl aminopeptidase